MTSFVLFFSGLSRPASLVWFSHIRVAFSITDLPPVQPAVDYSKWKGELTHSDVATLALNGKSVQCLVCTDGRTGGLIVMRHDYCLNVWTSHCEKSQTHIRKMAARRRAIELGQTTKKRKQQSLTMWMNPKKAKKTRCEEKVVVVTREVASTDADQCAGAYNLVHGPFINRTMSCTKYLIPVATSEHKKGKYMGMDAIYSKECSKIWTVECKKGGNMCGSCSMIRNKWGGCSLLVMMKMWEASIQRGLERSSFKQ